MYIDYTSRDIIQGISVSNNIFANTSKEFIYNETGRPSIVSIERNLYDNTPAMYNASDRSPRIGNPQFANAARNDFELQPRSPAIGVGLVISGITRDYEYRVRSLGSKYDIGAYACASSGRPR